MSKRMTDRERLKLAMDQPDTIGDTDWIGWLEIVIREMHKDADHIRDLEAQLARVRELPGKWRKEELPAAAKERRYPWKRGLLKCSGELEAALDNPKPEG